MKTFVGPLVLVLGFVSAPAWALGEPLSLEQALSMAMASQPRLAAAQARLDATAARLDQAQAGGWPQVSLNAGVQALPWQLAPSAGLNVDQLLWDSQRTARRVDAAQDQREADRFGLRNAQLAVRLDVRGSYFAAQAAQVMVAVAREALANQQRHQDQVSHQVQIGTRPPIDLALANRDLADARLALLQAQNDDAVALSRLGQAVGQPQLEPSAVDPGTFGPVAGEDLAMSAMMDEAARQRPDLQSLDWQRQAQAASLEAQRAIYWPSLSASARVKAAGTPPLDGTLGLNLSWPLWNGGAHPAEIREAEAALAGVDAQLESQRLQARFEIAQARQAVQTGKQAVLTAAESTRASREQLTLAEGRYAAGVGSILELSDAQLALVRSRGQEAQQQQKLSTARAQLLAALGRS